MASFFNLGGRFGRQANKTNGQQQNQQLSPTTTSPNQSSPSPQPAFSPPSTNAMATERSHSSDGLPMAQYQQQHQPPQPQTQTKKLPFYFREEHSGLIVKGNFMTLAAKPEHVEKGEWMAHQVVEQYRLLEAMLKVIQENDTRSGLPICNPTTCPHMTAASNTIYTWLDNHKNPIRIPAQQYITLVQRWIMGKVNDHRIFPTDTSFLKSSATYPSGDSTSGPTTPIPAGPTNLNASLSTLAGRDWLGKASGFPESFENDIKSLYRQMFRCYAHLYYAHWVEPFYHLGGTKELNTSFVHFVNVGKQFDLLADKDLAPMQPLVDIWLAKGYLPNTQQIQPDSGQASSA